VIERTNQEWLSALRGLGYALAGHPNVDDSALEDFAQDALLKILAGLDSFRGRAASPPGRKRSPCAWPCQVLTLDLSVL